MIDQYNDVADEIAMYITDDIFPELSPLEDKKRQSEICKICFEDFRKRGCKVGINVWPSLNLYQVERNYYPNMRRMVGIDGKVIETLACPVSDEFMEYMCKKYTIFAEAKPDFIWLDDDCRFTHMGGFYPCFCDECIKNFKQGVFKSREDLVEALSKFENRDLRIIAIGKCADLVVLDKEYNVDATFINGVCVYNVVSKNTNKEEEI